MQVHASLVKTGTGVPEVSGSGYKHMHRESERERRVHKLILFSK
jgi:hypothetical protein